jgi:limonene-1,2-epoxide hydrolase
MEPEQTVRELFRLLAVPDTRQAVTLLADDIVWKNTGLPTISGRRVGAMLLDAEKRGLGVDVVIHHAATNGEVVLTDRTDVLRKGSWESSFRVRGTFEVREGKIVLWDDAFSWLAFAKGAVVGLGRMI